MILANFAEGIYLHVHLIREAWQIIEHSSVVHQPVNLSLPRMDPNANEAPQEPKNPYLDSDFDFGKENAFMLNEVQNDIAFNLNKIQQKYIYTKMGRDAFWLRK